MFWKNSKFFVKDIDEDTDGVDASFEENIIIIFTVWLMIRHNILLNFW